MNVIEPVTAIELQQYYTLRWKILRAPWNQPRGSERDALDSCSTHLMVVADNRKVIAAGRLHFNSIREAQLRYMAVDLQQQRKGVGTLLLQALEQRAVTLGAAHIILDARECALRFYRKNGYVAQGAGHVLFNTITHVQMTKSLDNLNRPASAAHS